MSAETWPKALHRFTETDRAAMLISLAVLDGARTIKKAIQEAARHAADPT